MKTPPVFDNERVLNTIALFKAGFFMEPQKGLYLAPTRIIQSALCLLWHKR